MPNDGAQTELRSDGDWQLRPGTVGTLSERASRGWLGGYLSHCANLLGTVIMPAFLQLPASRASLRELHKLDGAPVPWTDRHPTFQRMALVCH